MAFFSPTNNQVQSLPVTLSQVNPLKTTGQTTCSSRRRTKLMRHECVGTHAAEFVQSRGRLQEPQVLALKTMRLTLNQLRTSNLRRVELSAVEYLGCLACCVRPPRELQSAYSVSVGQRQFALSGGHREYVTSRSLCQPVPPASVLRVQFMRLKSAMRDNKFQRMSRRFSVPA